MYQPLMRAAELAIVARAIYTWDEPVANGLAADAEVMDELRRSLADQFAEALARTNSQFDRERFIRAATTGQNVRSAG
jgi:hypothetical protein